MHAVHYSKAGSLERVKEEATYMLFLDLLYYCEGNYCALCALTNLTDKNMYTDEGSPEVTLEEVLNFFTGATYPPPLGFDVPASVWFSPTAEFPQASTCALQLTLPTKYYGNPERFHDKMVYALKNHGGFGLL